LTQSGHQPLKVAAVQTATVRRRSSLAARREAETVQLARERDEALEQLSAT
jgi:hypothetical protein